MATFIGTLTVHRVFHLIHFMYNNAGFGAIWHAHTRYFGWTLAEIWMGISVLVCLWIFAAVFVTCISSASYFARLICVCCVLTGLIGLAGANFVYMSKNKLIGIYVDIRQKNLDRLRFLQREIDRQKALGFTRADEYRQAERKYFLENIEAIDRDLDAMNSK